MNKRNLSITQDKLDQPKLELEQERNEQALKLIKAQREMIDGLTVWYSLVKSDLNYYQQSAFMEIIKS